MKYQYVTVDFPDIFSDYRIILGKDWWSLSNDLFYQLQSRPPKLEEYFTFIQMSAEFCHLLPLHRPWALANST